MSTDQDGSSDHEKDCREINFIKRDKSKDEKLEMKEDHFKKEVQGIKLPNSSARKCWTRGEAESAELMIKRRRA